MERVDAELGGVGRLADGGGGVDHVLLSGTQELHSSRGIGVGSVVDSLPVPSSRTVKGRSPSVDQRRSCSSMVRVGK